MFITPPEIWSGGTPQKQNIKNNDINKKQHTEEPRVFLSSTF